MKVQLVGGDFDGETFELALDRLKRPALRKVPGRDRWAIYAPPTIDHPEKGLILNMDELNAGGTPRLHHVVTLSSEELAQVPGFEDRTVHLLRQ